MRETVHIFIYIVFAFIPVILMKWRRPQTSLRLFWTSWFVSLTGAFAGGAIGSVMLARTNLEFSFLATVLPAFAGAWLLSILFQSLRRIPENW
jgi:uncharacterized membrane protein YeaQ/YmgE (transglycosylase-associated protein family)